MGICLGGVKTLLLARRMLFGDAVWQRLYEQLAACGFGAIDPVCAVSEEGDAIEIDRLRDFVVAHEFGDDAMKERGIALLCRVGVLATILTEYVEAQQMRLAEWLVQLDALMALDQVDARSLEPLISDVNRLVSLGERVFIEDTEDGVGVVPAEMQAFVESVADPKWDIEAEAVIRARPL